MFVKQQFLKIIKKESFVEMMYLFLIQIFNVLLPLFITPYLMIKLGLNGYGIYGFTFAFAQYFILLIDFGFNLSATKRIAIYKDNILKRNKIFKSTLMAKIFICTLLTLVYFVVICTIGKLEVYYKGLLLIYPILIFNSLTFQWFYQGIGQMKKFSLMTFATKVLILPLTLIFVKSESDVYIAIGILAITYFLNMVLNLSYIFKNKLINIRIGVDRNDIKNEIKESFPIFLSTASSSIYTQLFVVILGFFAPLKIVGIYTSSEKIVRSLFGIVYLPITQVFFHRISNMAILDRRNAKKIFHLICKIMIIVFSTMSLAIFFLADYIYLILGKTYFDIIEQLKLMSVLPVLLGIGAVYGQLGMIALGDLKSKKNFRNIYIIGGLCSLIFSFVLIPKYLEYGAVISLISTEFIIASLMVGSFYNFKFSLK